jgi:four helix bundle protein
MRNFRELKVWQKSHQLTLEVYKATLSFPKEEIYGLTSQMRRSSCSIAANMAEGCGKDSEKELIRFFQIAAGSASELEYHLLLSYDLGLLQTDTYKSLDKEVNEVKKMLISFIQKLKLTANS